MPGLTAIWRRMSFRSPGDVGGGGQGVEATGEDEEVVAQAVDVDEDIGVYAGAGVGECEDGALGAAADGACDVGLGCGNASAGEDECALRGDL